MHESSELKRALTEYADVSKGHCTRGLGNPVTSGAEDCCSVCWRLQEQYARAAIKVIDGPDVDKEVSKVIRKYS